MKKDNLIKKMSVVVSLFAMLVLASCSEDINGADGNKNLNGYNWKKAKYSTCEIQIGEHSYIFDVSKGDTVEFRGEMLYLYHRNIPYDQYKYIGDKVESKIYLDFEAYSITYMDYFYASYNTVYAGSATGRLGSTNDHFFNCKVLNLPFTIDKTGEIKVLKFGVDLEKYFILYQKRDINGHEDNNYGGHSYNTDITTTLHADSTTIFMLVLK